MFFISKNTKGIYSFVDFYDKKYQVHMYVYMNVLVFFIIIIYIPRNIYIYIYIYIYIVLVFFISKNTKGIYSFVDFYDKKYQVHMYVYMNVLVFFIIIIYIPRNIYIFTKRSYTVLLYASRTHTFRFYFGI